MASQTIPPKANLLLRRFVAYWIDWYIGGVIISLPIIYKALEMWPENTDVSQTLLQFDSELAFQIGRIVMLIALFYYVIIPSFIWNGQTLGKKITKVRIVKADDSEAGFLQLFIRYGIVIFMIEGSLFTVSHIIQEMIGILTNTQIITTLSTIGLVFTGLTVVCTLIDKKSRAIHDALSKTKVIIAKAG